MQNVSEQQAEFIRALANLNSRLLTRFAKASTAEEVEAITDQINTFAAAQNPCDPGHHWDAATQQCVLDAEAPSTSAAAATQQS
jgi:hypothetical protein